MVEMTVGSRSRTFSNLQDGLAWQRQFVTGKKTEHVTAGLPLALRKKLEHAKRVKHLSMAHIVRLGLAAVLS